MKNAKTAGRSANILIGRLAGVSETDSKVVAAEKAIRLAKLGGLNTKGMEKMLADYKRQNGIR